MYCSLEIFIQNQTSHLDPKTRHQNPKKNIDHSLFPAISFNSRLPRLNTVPRALKAFIFLQTFLWFLRRKENKILPLFPKYFRNMWQDLCPRPLFVYLLQNNILFVLRIQDNDGWRLLLRTKTISLSKIPILRTAPHLFCKLLFICYMY